MEAHRAIDSNPSICFVAHNACGALCGGQRGHIGGVERQTSLMAHWFVERGYRVSMLTWDEGQPDGTDIDGVRLFNICERDAGFPIIRALNSKMTSAFEGRSFR